MVGTRTEPRLRTPRSAAPASSTSRRWCATPTRRTGMPTSRHSVWGGLVAPPALLIGLLMPPPWVPNGEPPTAVDRGPGASPRHRDHQRVQRRRVSDADVGGRHARAWSRRWCRCRRRRRPDSAPDISSRHWRLIYRGDGARRRDMHEHVVPLHPDGSPMTWDDVVTVPAQLPEVVDQISYERVVMNAGATWDYFPWHYDPEYAKGHGHPTIFVNTMHLAGFVDRIATDFGGSVQPGGAAQGVTARLDLRRRFDGGAWPRGRQAHRYRR